IRSVLVIVVPLCLFLAAAYAVSSAAKSAFVVEEIVFSGNEHLTDEELKILAGLSEGDNLFSFSGKGIHRKMIESPWIRSISVRKDLPGRLHILITEAEPFALLDMKGHLFIVDDRGRMLEELKDSSMPFLPVISSDPYTEKEVYSEAISLARAIRDTGLLSRKNHIEIIAHRPHEIAANVDGVLVKVGTGDYAEKLGRLMELEEDIRNRRIPVDYIDLRFANRVVVKQVSEVIRK
ncbi:MAG: FtsQ-type POTRA domain-containing protein, partial [Nitrospirae bacterium]|nr:FtsQ-type POTRA domain-containing protein [Nitrospirota bacterium]